MPRLGITLGDPRGIGPEVTAAALSSLSGVDGIDAVLVGPRSLGEVEDDTPVAHEVSLRLLRHLASSVRHRQYHDTDIVTVRVDAPR